MDERTKELAEQYLRKYDGWVGSYDRFPIKFDDPVELTARIIGWYGNIVRNRTGEFLFDDNVSTKTQKVVKWMTESKKRGLLLCGTVGNGKTTMLRALYNIFGCSNSVLMDSQVLYDQFKEKQQLPGISPRQILLIDDLGVEPQAFNDFGQMRYPLAELLMSRYKTNSTTIVATNFSVEQLGEYYGDRVEDRIREMFAMIVYTEPSYRRK